MLFPLLSSFSHSNPISRTEHNYKPKAWEYLIQPDYRLVWCNVFKAASTSWMYNFNLMAGYSTQFLNKTKDVPVQLARQKYPRPSVEKVCYRREAGSSSDEPLNNIGKQTLSSIIATIC